MELSGVRDGVLRQPVGADGAYALSSGRNKQGSILVCTQSSMQIYCGPLTFKSRLWLVRDVALTGVNEFPNLGEAPLAQADSRPGVVRYAAAFEALRNRSDAYLAKTGKRPQAVLLPVGPLAEHNIRTTFASNLLASGGIEAVNPGTVDANGVFAVADGHAAAVVCGTDARYADEASDVVKAARAAGITHVYLAGPEKAVADATDKPDDYLTMKIDAVEALSTLLTRLGA